MSRPSAYILCTSPRSGSTLLCSLLRATGAAGYPESWFHEPSLAQWAEGLDIPLPGGPEDAQIATLIEAAQTRGRAGGSIFALRLQRQSAPFFLKMLSRQHPDLQGDLARIRRSFGNTRFLFLTRPDKVTQAVSYLRAQQSGLWHRAADGSELERLAPPQVSHYDAAFLSEWVETFTRYDAEWRGWFAQEGIEPLELSYDRLARAPVETLRQVLDALSLDPRLADGVAPGVQRLADTTSARWVARFKREAERDRATKADTSGPQG